MKLVSRLYYFSIYTNLLIALAAAAQCALTYIFFEKPFNYYIIAIEGAATLLLYNFSLILSKPADPAASIYSRTRWIFSRERLLWLSGGYGLRVLVYAVFHSDVYRLLFLGGLGVVSVAYSFPVGSYGGQWVGLRQLPGMKIFHIALVWTMSSVCLT